MCKWKKVPLAIFILFVLVEQCHMRKDEQFDGIKIGMCTKLRVCVSLFLIFFTFLSCSNKQEMKKIVKKQAKDDTRDIPASFVDV